MKTRGHERRRERAALKAAYEAEASIRALAVGDTTIVSDHAIPGSGSFAIATAAADPTIPGHTPETIPLPATPVTHAIGIHDTLAVPSRGSAQITHPCPRQ